MRIGPMEITLILVVCLVVFGAKNLPGIGAKAGKAVKEFKLNTKDFSDSVKLLNNEVQDIKKVITDDIQENITDDENA